MKVLFFTLVLIATISYVLAGKCSNGEDYEIDIAGGKSCLLGYNFDGPVERGAWRAYWWTRSLGKVTDCNSYCQFKDKKPGQCCNSEGEDMSSWCEGKHTCSCIGC